MKYKVGDKFICKEEDVRNVLEEIVFVKNKEYFIENIDSIHTYLMMGENFPIAVNDNTIEKYFWDIKQYRKQKLLKLNEK